MAPVQLHVLTELKRLPQTAQQVQLLLLLTYLGTLVLRRAGRTTPHGQTCTLEQAKVRGVRGSDELSRLFRAAFFPGTTSQPEHVQKVLQRDANLISQERVIEVHNNLCSARLDWKLHLASVGLFAKRFSLTPKVLQRVLKYRRNLGRWQELHVQQREQLAMDIGFELRALEVTSALQQKLLSYATPALQEESAENATNTSSADIAPNYGALFKDAESRAALLRRINTIIEKARLDSMGGKKLKRFKRE